MKKRLPFILLSVLAISLASCGDNSSSDGGDGDFDQNTNEFNQSTDEEVSSGGSIDLGDFNVALHYKNDNVKYSDYEVWTWDWKTLPSGRAEAWTTTDDFGAVYYLNTENYKDPNNIGVIVRSKGSWNWQTPDQFIVASDYTEDANGIKHIYSVLGGGDVLTLFTNPEDAMGDRVKTAKFTSFDTIKVEATAPVDHYYIFENDALIASGKPEDDKFNIKLNRKVEPHNNYRIESYYYETDKVSSTYVSFEKIFHTDEFIEKYTYTKEAPLGVSFENGKTIFRLWAPICSDVELNIYNSGTKVGAIPGVEGDDTKESHKMQRKSQGVYELSLDGDLSGKYYTYTVTNYNGVLEAVDPYAVSAGINGDRGYIINLDSAQSKPEGWDNISFEPIKSNADYTVYELHVQDMTMSETWKGTEEYRGTFKGMIEKGTTYKKNGITVTTGFDHINELGVNAVQILPFYDHANDETDMVANYNWGYNPKNYNVPEGIYSTNPYDGLTRVKETREAILALSQTDVGTRTIMDVVYNHVASAYSSSFTTITPGYFFRYDENGKLLNGSGCGNEFKTESIMGRRFIKDSLVHWAKNYQIKGFRFDLMGLIDCQTLKESAELLYEIDPSIVCYGEAWMAMGDWGTAVNNMQAVSDNVFNYLYAYEEGNPTDKPDWDTKSRIAVGAFNDAGRDNMRGGNGGGGPTGGEPSGGWITNGGDSTRLTDMIMGVHTDKGSNVTQVVNYLSCHDNYTIYDQLAYNVTSNKNVAPNLSEVGNAAVAAYAGVFFSQGIAFMQSGDEFLRTKVEIKNEDGTYQGSPEAIVNMFGKDISHNSYMSHPQVNALHYDRKVDAIDTFNKFKEAIALREQLNDTVFGHLFPNNTDAANVSKWGIQPVNGYGMNINYGGKTYYLLGANRFGTTIEIGNAQLKVLYSSTGENDGKTLNVTNGKITLGSYETILVEQL